GCAPCLAVSPDGFSRRGANGDSLRWRHGQHSGDRGRHHRQCSWESRYSQRLVGQAIGMAAVGFLDGAVGTCPCRKPLNRNMGKAASLADLRRSAEKPVLHGGCPRTWVTATASAILTVLLLLLALNSGAHGWVWLGEGWTPLS